jgi:aminopeptidase N
MPSCKNILLILFLASFLLQAAAKKHDDYFQQRLRYKINAELNPYLHRIDAEERLVYINNSPDTLDAIYFHLYLNKYKKNAYMEDGLRKCESGGITIFKIEENDSLQKNYSIDHTLMKLKLHQSVDPGDSVRFYFKFASKMPPASGRYGYMGDHFDVGNWYPTPVVYDRAGWHLNQHIDNEFYQEWADFRVDLRVPKGFIVGATGNLLNADSALQDTSQAVKKWFYHNIEDTITTLWQFEAKMVHDFAWTADPEYVLLQNEWNGINLNVLTMEHNAEDWKQVTEWGLEALKFYIQNYGPYPYKQLTIADTYVTAGGIEYPNIVFINTFISPDYALNHFKAVVVHEMAHNWFYGLLASNQTEEEWLDEGFATFAEIQCMEALFGKYDNYSYNRGDWFSKTFSYEINERRDNALSYLWWTKEGGELNPIDYMPDYFGDGVYISQYSKMANVLFMLQYVMGDSLFDAGLKNYYHKWRFKHPYPEDFIAVMEETAGRDLDWFFEQWLKSIGNLDYAVESVNGKWVKKGDGRQYAAKIKLGNRGDIFMPVDLDIKLKNGDTARYQIPIDSHSKPERNRKVLPYWHFTQSEYTAEINLPGEIDYVEIDQSLRLMDVNRLNNRSGLLPPMTFTFMHPQSVSPPLDKYLWEGWPLAFYNDYDKAKLGFKFEGSYLDIDHKIDASLWYKTAYGNVDYDLCYQNPAGWLGMRSYLKLRTFTLDGRQGSQIGLSKQINKNNGGEPYYKIGLLLSTHLMFAPQYLTSDWDKGRVNTIDLSWKRISRKNWRQKSELCLVFRNSIMGGDFQFSQAILDWKRYFWGDYSDFELDVSFKGGYSEGRAPAQSQFTLSGANGWREFSNPYYRSRGTLPYPWRREGHLYLNEGSKVRGFSLYPEDTDLTGKKILAFSADLKFPNPFESTFFIIIRDIIPSVFADAGQVWDGAFPKYKDFRKSAGISLTWDRFYWLQKITYIERVRFDFPLWMSHTPDDAEHFDFRWLVSFNFDLE